MSLRTTIRVLAASALLAASLPAFADHNRSDRGYDRWGQRGFEQRHMSRDIGRRPVYAQRRVVVERPVYVERPIYVEQPVYGPVYDPVAYPAPVYPVQAGYPRGYGEVNVVGAAAGAAIGAVIGSQVGYGHNRGTTAAVGAAIGGLLGSQF